MREKGSCGARRRGVEEVFTSTHFKNFYSEILFLFFFLFCFEYLRRIKNELIENFRNELELFRNYSIYY